MGKNLRKFAKIVFSLFSRSSNMSKVDDEKMNSVKLTKKAELRGAAFANLGNTCFLNSVLQCLIHLTPLVKTIFSVHHIAPCASNFCCFCELKNIIAKSIKCSNSVLKPKSIARNLTEISEDFRLGKQSDGHEFLNCFLNKLESSMDYNCSKTIEITKELFGGSLQSKTWSPKCGHGSERSESFIDLSLDLKGNTKTIEDALKSFIKPELLEGTFSCDECNRHSSQKAKQMKLEKSPQVLLLHLKRFLNHGSHVQKISRPVQYPAVLDLRPFLVCPKKDEETKYDLYALVVHEGTPTYGHYFSFVRTSPSTWHLFNDNQVSRVSLERTLNQEAYLLFYIKKGVASWFSDICFANG